MIGNGCLHFHSLPIPTWSIPIPSHPHSQFCNQFPFPWDSHWAIPIPIPKQLFNRCVINIFGVSNIRLICNIIVLSLSLNVTVSIKRRRIVIKSRIIISPYPTTTSTPILLPEIITHHCIRRWGFISMGIRPFPFPYRVIPIPSHSHAQLCHQFPFSWDSHWIPNGNGNPIIGNPIPMIISSTDVPAEYGWSVDLELATT